MMPKNKQVGSTIVEEDSKHRNFDKSASKSNNPPHIYAPSAISAWPGSRPIDLKSLHHPDIDLTRG